MTEIDVAANSIGDSILEALGGRTASPTTLTHRNGSGFVLTIDDNPVAIAQIERMADGGFTVKAGDGSWHTFRAVDAGWELVLPKVTKVAPT